MYRKNTAGQFIYFCLVNSSTGAALTGATVTAYRALDGAAQASATGSTTELANGQYRFALSQADTNADYGSYLFTATSAVPVEKTIVFTAANPTDSVRFGLTALPNAAAGASGGLPTGDGSGRVLLQPTQTGVTIPTVTGVTNGVTVSTNNDKTGYSLTQSFPSNFASLSIDVSGRVLLQPTQTGVTIPTVASVTNGVTVSTLANNVITAASIAASALDGKGNWNVGKTGYSLTQAFPTNFAAMAITAGGAVTVGTNNDKTGYSLTQSFPSNFASLSIDVSGRVLLQPTQTGVTIPTVTAVTNRVTANADQLAGQTITAAAGVTFPSVVASQVTLEDTLDAANNASNTAGRLDTALELDGAVYRFTTNALEQAPAGGGGGGGTDWTANERTAIRSVLGIPTSGTTPTDPTVGILDTIRDKTNLISAGSIPIVSPLTASGKFSGPIIQGDDYLAANGRAFTWTIGSITGITPGTATVRFAGKSRVDNSTFAVSGTVTDLGTGKWTLSCDMSRTISGALVVGEYDWSVEITSASGTEVTPVRAGSDMIVATKF